MKRLKKQLRLTAEEQGLSEEDIQKHMKTMREIVDEVSGYSEVGELVACPEGANHGFPMLFPAFTLEQVRIMLNRLVDSQI